LVEHYYEIVWAGVVLPGNTESHFGVVGIKGQGTTVERAYVVLSGPMQDKELTYVQVSRAGPGADAALHHGGRRRRGQQGPCQADAHVERKIPGSRNGEH
jgi:hypothetical protein